MWCKAISLRRLIRIFLWIKTFQLEWHPEFLLHLWMDKNDMKDLRGVFFFFFFLVTAGGWLQSSEKTPLYEMGKDEAPTSLCFFGDGGKNFQLQGGPISLMSDSWNNKDLSSALLSARTTNILVGVKRKRKTRSLRGGVTGNGRCDYKEWFNTSRNSFNVAPEAFT